MSYNKTDGIPHDHPLAQLLARSQKANKLPSCEGCKYGGLEVSIGGIDPFIFCELPDSLKSPIRLDDSRCGIEVTRFTHFCAAWEPKQ
jgi:hypothetical protein